MQQAAAEKAMRELKLELEQLKAERQARPAGQPVQQPTFPSVLCRDSKTFGSGRRGKFPQPHAKRR